MPTALMHAAQALHEVERAWNPTLAGDLGARDNALARDVYAGIGTWREKLELLSDETALRAAGDLRGRIKFYQAPSGLRYAILDGGMPYWLENGVLVTASVRASDGGINWDEAGDVAFGCIDTLDAGECRKVEQYLVRWARNGAPPQPFAVRSGENVRRMYVARVDGELMNAAPTREELDAELKDNDALGLADVAIEYWAEGAHNG